MFHISLKKTIAYCLGLFFLGSLLLTLLFSLFLLTPADGDGKEQVIFIENGLSLRQVAERLEARTIVTNGTLFMIWARVLGHGRRIKAGEYRLGPAMTPAEILEKMARGIIVLHSVTIPEGFTNTQIAELLGEKGLVSKDWFLSIIRDNAVMEKYCISGPSLEGYLYPDTYQFGRGISAITAIDTMIRRFKEMVEPLEHRIEEIGIPLKDVITLASIVEKETGIPEERPLIASVFLNRLKRSMRLESDPTVIYGIEDFNGNLTRDDLSRPTPYNTYVIRGLPPGPIANPGLASIKAVLYPAQTDYLYFVSKNDGSHYFSRTLSEHKKAVQIYQKKKG
jgi:UPF0755 protein